MNLIRDKWELKNKITEMETQKSMANQREDQYEAQVAGLEAQKSSLEVLLKGTKLTKDIYNTSNKTCSFSQK